MPDPTPATRTVCAHVVLDLVAKSAGDAIEQLAAGFSSIQGVPTARTLAAAVLEREAQASTFLGHAAALPHARLIGVPHLAIAFGRARRPIPWTRDADPVELVFLGVVPAEQPRHYLEFMRVLARSLSQAATAEALLAAPDETAVREWLRDHLRLQ
ncbi:MAG: PTS sugar transporter subunit IIA [Opitutaceae bacterium]